MKKRARKAKTLEEIDAELAEIDKLQAEAKEADPFWFYQPSTGEISPERKTFLKEYLKDEDIPPKLDGQLDVHLSTAETIGASGGNQGGKSTVGSVACFIQGTGELPDSLKGIYPKEKLPTKFPQKIRVVGVSGHTLYNTVLPTYKYWCPKKYLKKGSFTDSYSAQHDTLYLYDNNKEIASVEFKTNQQDVETFQGPPLDLVIYDEEPTSEIHAENRMRFVTTKMNFLFCWTPTKGLSWTSELFSDDKDEMGNNIERFQLCSVTNPKADLHALRSILNDIHDYNELKMRVLGEFVSLSGLIYGKLFNRSIHVIEPFELDHNKYIVYRGLDPHLVKPTVCVEIALDREGFEYVVGCYSREADTEIIKADLAQRAKERKYRLGWTRCDKSADSTIHALGDRNIFLELGRGENAVPALDTSEKFTGSIHAGVDTIKKLLKVNELTNKPKLYIFNIPENKILINAMKMLERETYSNEDKKGKKDRIMEGKYDAHACLRYVHQRIMNWIPPFEGVPEYDPANKNIGY